MKLPFYVYIIFGMLGSFSLCIGILILYFRYRKGMLQHKFETIAATVAHQKKLLSTVIATQEQERKRIGMDLHDQVGTALSSIKFILAEPEKNSALIHKQINEIIASVRSIAHDLSPRMTGEYGFYDALLEYCDVVNQSGQLLVQVTFKSETAQVFLTSEQGMTVYRVITELITNTLKHAHARHIYINFYFTEQHFEISYQDDGTGISGKPFRSGIGFQNIESRISSIQASMEMKEPGTGFLMIIAIPLNLN